MNRIGGFPWTMTFSYGRALQNAALHIWRGRPENVPAAQAAFNHRAEMNSLAALGRWRPDLEQQAAA
jgi:fructose-bisphosphate aldolase class I